MGCPEGVARESATHFNPEIRHQFLTSEPAPDTLTAAAERRGRADPTQGHAVDTVDQGRWRRLDASAMG